MRFCYTDYFSDDSYTASVSDYASGYGVSNAQDSRLSKYWKSSTLTNLITGGDGESVVSPYLDGSSSGTTNATWARSSTQAQAGTYSWVLTKTSAAAAGDAYVYLVDSVASDDMHGLTAGYTYRTKVYMYTDCATPGNAQYIVQEYYSASWHDVCTLSPSAVGAWELEAGSFTLNSATTGVAIKVSIATGEALGKLLYLDEIKFFRENAVLLDAGSGSTLTPTVVAILGHNISSAATIKFQGNATDSWASPTVDETLTHDSGVILKFPTTQALRYWRISIDDFSNSDTYIKVGRVFIGTYLDVDYACSIGFPRNIVENSSKSVTPTGQVFGSTLGTKLLNYQLNFPWFTNTMKNSIETMYDTVRNYKPWIIVFDNTDLTSVKPCYVTIDEIGFQHIYNYNWSGKLSVTEAK